MDVLMATPLSMTASETAKKGVTLALKAFATPGKAAACAEAMGTSEPTISKLKNDKLAEVITLLAYLGLQVVPTDYAMVDPAMLEISKRLFAKVMDQAPNLLWEPDA